MKIFDKSFERIIDDRVSGSAEILEKLNRYFIKKIKDNISIKDEVNLAKKRLNHFAGINCYLNRIQKELLKKDRISLLNYLLKVKDSEHNVYKNIYDKIPGKIKSSKTFLTLSNSKTIFEILKLFQRSDNKIKVIVSEARPGCEGMILAKRLKKEGIQTKIIPDSHISNYIIKSDLLMLGCDIILKNGDIINKTGSRNAAIISNYFKKPVIVVSSKEKRINKNKVVIKGRDEKEKLLFERVEKKYINFLITD